MRRHSARRSVCLTVLTMEPPALLSPPARELMGRASATPSGRDRRAFGDWMCWRRLRADRGLGPAGRGRTRASGALYERGMAGAGDRAGRGGRLGGLTSGRLEPEL